MNLKRRKFLKQGLLLSTSMLGSAHVQGTLCTNVLIDVVDKEGSIVINAGIGGNNTQDLLNRIEKDCLIKKPKLTILMAGTNDMNSVKHIPLNQYEQNLKAMVQKIIQSKSKLLMMTILPAYEPDLLTRHPSAFYEPEGVSGRRQQLNDVVKRLAKSNNVSFLDLCQRFEAIGKIGTGEDSLLQNEANSNKRDGIHPTANGYRFIALAVYDHILAYGLPRTGILCFGDSITRGDGSIEKDSYPAYLKKLLASSNGLTDRD